MVDSFSLKSFLHSYDFQMKCHRHPTFSSSSFCSD
jgi:hypothetical protein